VRTVVHHPQGFGLGNAGETASRTKTPVKAGESTYTEVGVETGLAGAIVFVAWLAALLVGLVQRRTPWLAASLAAVLALAVQTDVLGVPWIAYCVVALAATLLVPLAVVDAEGDAVTTLAPWPRRSMRARTSPTPS
jgi:hypothetical protein